MMEKWNWGFTKTAVTRCHKSKHKLYGSSSGWRNTPPITESPSSFLERNTTNNSLHCSPFVFLSLGLVCLLGPFVFNPKALLCFYCDTHPVESLWRGSAHAIRNNNMPDLSLQKLDWTLSSSFVQLKSLCQKTKKSFCTNCSSVWDGPIQTFMFYVIEEWFKNLSWDCGCFMLCCSI